jgi:putative endonuclease
MKQPAIYIMANKADGVLYVGVTSDLVKRVYEHKNNINSGFASRYNCDKLVYFELFSDMENAILREKQIKAGSREKKIKLIESTNPKWEDLYARII